MNADIPRFLPATGVQDDEAKPWVLLRGLVREHRHWGDFPQRLADRLGVPVYCPDLPGNGTYCRESSALSLEQALASVRESLALPGPLNLLGLSMGAMVAARWALRYPHEVAGLVVINTSFGDMSPPWQRIRPPALIRLLRALMQSSDAREATIFDISCNRSDTRDATLTAWRRYAAENPVSHGNFLRQLLASARCRAGGKHPLAPTLVLACDQDRLVSPACSATIAERWGARLEYHSSAGHDLPHDDPDWVIERIERWQSDRAWTR
ncbi:alpha/beta hydrolase [Marinobacterium nitratireducens]|uniref:Alpha/beta hydrolase n=1 Tax=Marinobacterium nitratireducens TaxID=518897 RepID=A0A918DMZ8_9GAMM|nr:alpha/beta hydrolase [Marinobacterium nitratireducens]GGO76128.1 alpha/beta hydrolase [Marinobacterium nitratireducens]